ncbi:hypothetical protein RRG08_038124 [Elysia crispata]|uniref:Uncharacterized protein n=1 Tax=Elysia crispata TaxID=231223 RepID=A0AAE0ZY73_9GAST|nr:hypothetical protein RRG08_038124 [Elysia crispata]
MDDQKPTIHIMALHDDTTTEDHHQTNCTSAPPPGLDPGQYCPAEFDDVLCWKAAPENTTAVQPCIGTVMAHRHCHAGGYWDNKSDYAACIDAFNRMDESTPSPPEIDNDTAIILSYVYFIGCVISLGVLVISLFIFLWFKSLQCQRTSIHKNLIISFILRFLVIIILFEPVVFDHDLWYSSHEWLCRGMWFLKYFAMVANFFWMLVEGFFLHLILVLRPLDNQKAPFLLFYFIGWVIPFLVTLAWAVVMQINHESKCWSDNSSTPYILIIYVPIMLSLLINLLILMNLVRIVIAKLCSGHTNERSKICRTIKSTVLLVFLLGIINLLFFYRPHNKQGKIIYRYVNAILPPLQGIFVSLLYCVMNAEVQRALKKRWNRFQDSRNMNGQSYLRRRSSRTSMTMFVSHHNQSNGPETQFNVMEMQPLKDTNGVKKLNF